MLIVSLEQVLTFVFHFVPLSPSVPLIFVVLSFFISFLALLAYFLLLLFLFSQPPVVFCHPVANCFHRRSPAEDDEDCESSLPVPTLTLPHGNGAVSTSDAGTGAGAKAKATGTAEAEAETGKDSSKSPVKDQVKKSDGESVAAGSSKSNKESQSPRNSNSQAEVVPEHAYISTFIIGLSFQKGSRFIDIEPPIQVNTSVFIGSCKFIVKITPCFPTFRTGI